MAETDNSSSGAANVTNCPARFSNAVGATIAENSAGTWWCSDQFAIEEYALITCRQRINFCGETIIPTFSSTTASPVSRTINTAFDASEKCTWLITATRGAPTFKIKTSTGIISDVSFDLHFIEYDDSITKRSTTDWIDGTFPTTTGANKIQSTNYDKN